MYYENSLVGRASVQWGGRPRPPTDMAGQGRLPHYHQPFFIFRCVRKEMTVGVRPDKLPTITITRFPVKFLVSPQVEFDSTGDRGGI